MSEIQFTDIDAQVIYDSVINELSNGVQETLYAGDERLIFGEALSAVFIGLYNTMNDVAKQKTLRYARGEVLDALGERLDTKRLEPEKATTIIEFFAKLPLTKDIFIPAGTKISDEEGKCYFQTKSPAVLKKPEESTSQQEGETPISVTVVAEAVEGGTEYNGYDSGKICKLVDLIPFVGFAEIDVDKVSNITVTSGGDDGEPYDIDGDNSYRERIRLAPSSISAAGTAEAYRYYALAADPRLCDVKVVNTKDDEGNEKPGEITIYPLLKGINPDPNDYYGSSEYNNVMQDIEEIMSDPKIRSLTDMITVKRPEPHKYSIEIICYAEAKNMVAVENMVKGPGGALERYIEWQMGALGRPLNPDELIKRILSPDWEEGLIGARRVEILKPEEFKFEEIAEFKVAVVKDAGIDIKYAVYKE